MADLAGVVEVRAQPEGGATAADLGEIRSLTAVADERGMLLAQLFDGLRGTPHEDVGAVGADVLGVAVDAAFGDVDLTAALDGGEWRCVGVMGSECEIDEE